MRYCQARANVRSFLEINQLVNSNVTTTASGGKGGYSDLVPTAGVPLKPPNP